MYNCNFVAKKLEHNNTKPTKTIGKVKVSPSTFKTVKKNYK